MSFPKKMTAWLWSFPGPFQITHPNSHEITSRFKTQQPVRNHQALPAKPQCLLPLLALLWGGEPGSTCQGLAMLWGIPQAGRENQQLQQPQCNILHQLGAIPAQTGQGMEQEKDSEVLVGEGWSCPSHEHPEPTRPGLILVPGRGFQKRLLFSLTGEELQTTRM